MRYRSGIKPSKPMSCLAVIVGLGMGVFVWLAISANRGHRPQFTADVPVPGGPEQKADPVYLLFMGLFFLVLVGIVLYHVANLLSSSAPPVGVVETSRVDEGGEAINPKPPSHPDVSTRLRELDKLRDEGLITPEEYERKRREILDGL